MAMVNMSITVSVWIAHKTASNVIPKDARCAIVAFSLIIRTIVFQNVQTCTLKTSTNVADVLIIA